VSWTAPDPPDPLLSELYRMTTNLGPASAGLFVVPIGRSPDWLKFKNPEAPAVKREAEEDWGR
jgi:hypothetical protein